MFVAISTETYVTFAYKILLPNINPKLQDKIYRLRNMLLQTVNNTKRLTNFHLLFKEFAAPGYKDIIYKYIYKKITRFENIYNTYFE